MSAKPLTDIAEILASRWRDLPQDRKEAVLHKQLLKERQQLQQQLNSVTKERNELARRLEQSNIQDHSTQLAGRGLYEELTRLGNALHAEGRKAGRLSKSGDVQQQRKEFKSHIAVALACVEDMKAQRIALKTELKTAQKRAREEIAARAELQQGLNELKDELAQYQQHRNTDDALEQQLREAQSRLQALARRNKRLETDLELLRRHIKSAKGPLSGAMLVELEAMISALQEAIEELKRKLQDTQPGLEAHTSQLAAVERQLRENADMFKLKAGGLEQEEAKYQTAIRGLEQRLNAADGADRRKLAKERDQAFIEARRVQQQLEESRLAWKVEEAKLVQSREYLSSRAEAMAKSMEELTLELDRMEDKCLELQQQLEEARREMAAQLADGKSRPSRPMKSVGVQTQLSFQRGTSGALLASAVTLTDLSSTKRRSKNDRYRRSKTPKTRRGRSWLL